MHDNSLAVPMIIYDPRSGRHRDIYDMVLNIDIAPTIMEIAGVNAPAAYQGISLLPYVRSEKVSRVRREILFEHLWKLPQIPSSEGIRTERWKYFRYRFIDTPEELYDLKNDPLETINLSSDPKYRKVLERLRQACEEQISQYEKAKLQD
jgi:arylsulfatase A-like enzyme